MKYCSRCGKEIHEQETRCPHCGAEVQAALNEPMRTNLQLALAGCAGVSVISLLLNWATVELPGIYSISLSPVSMLNKLKEVGNTFGAFLPDKFFQSASTIRIGLLLLVVLNVITIVLALKKSLKADLAGMFANLSMLLVSGTFFYWGNKLEASTYGVFAMGIGVKIAMAAALIGLGLFVKLFSEQKKSVGDAFGYMGAGFIIVCLIFITGVKSMGIM